MTDEPSGPSDRPDPDRARRLARRTFLQGRRLDMSALAAELGINRVTLYRWFGSRDGLLAETVWSLAESALAEMERTSRRRGGKRVVELATGLLAQAIANPGMQRLLEEEGEHAMRLLTRHDGGFQASLVAAFERVLDEEARAGRMALPVAPHELAYVIVRLIESYAYLDLITGEPAEAGRARPILEMLLRV